MTMDTLTWTAEALGVPMVEETADGSIKANQAAMRALAGQAPDGLVDLNGLVDIVAQLAEVPPDETCLTGLIERGRAGERYAEHVNNRPILVSPVAHGIRVMVGPVHANASIRKRAAAADLAAGVSHEVANALSAIVGWSQLAREQPETATPTEALALIESSATTAQEAARDMLRTVRPAPRATGDSEESSESPAVDVLEVVRSVVRLLEPEARATQVNVRAPLPVSDAKWVAGTRADVFTIVWNLAQNAVQMLPPGGTVSFAVGTTRRRVCLEIEDDGPGMTPVQARKAFEQYYTTRDEGTGLGLPLVRRAVNRLGGTIELDTAPDRGAHFRIELPLANAVGPKTTGLAASAEASPTSPSEESRRNTGRNVSRSDTRATKTVSGVQPRAAARSHVLVVENDEAVRELIATTLTIRDFDVTAVSGVAEALKLSGPFSLGLLDLNLEDGRGDQLLAQLRQRGIVRSAALMSGAPPPADMSAAGSPDSWLRKPFDTTDLVATLRELSALTHESKLQTG